MAGLGRLAISLVAAVALLAANAQQARASIGSCLTAYTGADFFQLVGTFADPELSQCAAEIQVGPDIIMAAATAGMVALAFDGAFTDTAQCKALVQTTIGGFIAKLLLAATPVADFLKSSFPGAFNALVDMASGQAVGALGAVPGLGFILHKVDCGCQFAGAGLASKKALEDYYSSVKGCGQFFADVGDALLGVFQSGPEAAAEFFNGSNYGLTPGVQEEQVSYVVACAPGLNTACEVCWGGSAKLEKVGDKLACKCPSSNQGYTNSNDSGCQVCPAGTVQGPDGQCGGCPKGQAYQGGACVAACPTGQILGANGQCGGCPAGAHASYAEFKFVQEGAYSVVAPVNSLGACVVCPSGSAFSESQNKCVAGCPAWQQNVGGSCVNRCGPNEKFIPGSSGAISSGGVVIPGLGTKATCTPCPGGTQLDSATNICVKGGGPAPPTAPKCPSWQTWNGQACANICGPNLVHTPGVFTMGANGTGKITKPESCVPCAPGSQFNNKTNSCMSCPSGAAWTPFGDGSGGACKCPSGSVQQGGMCVSTAPLGQPKGGSTGGAPPVLIPGPGGFPQRGVASCPPGTVRSPQGACIPFRMSPAQPNGGGASPPVFTPGRDFQPSRAAPCPAGTTRNAQGACIALRAVPVQPSGGGTAPPNLRLPSGALMRAVDCSARGANYIRSPQAPGGCAACPDGLVANAARDNCVAPAMFNGMIQRVAPVRRGP